jgi:hypothetical protein
MAGFPTPNLRRVAGAGWDGRAGVSIIISGGLHCRCSIRHRDERRSFFHAQTDALNRQNPTTGISEITLPAQPVDATQALNLSAGVSNCKVSRGRSLS